MMAMTEQLIPALAGVSIFCVILAIVLPLLNRDNRKKRIQNLFIHGKKLQTPLDDGASTLNESRNISIYVNQLRDIFQRFKLDRLTSSSEIKNKLVLAGWRRPNAVIIFSTIKFCLPGLLIALASFFIAIDQKYSLTIGPRFLILLGSGVVGFYLPDLLVKNQIQKRQQDMQNGFSDALDLLLICVQSGLTVEAAFTKVAEEISKNSPTLAEEFGLTSAELAFLSDREKAYSNLAQRTGLPIAKSLSTTLNQADKYGTPVGRALKILSEETKGERMARAEEKGASLPAKLTVPMIVFFLPALFLVIIGPAILKMTSG
jgi:tight adherence protein C